MKRWIHASDSQQVSVSSLHPGQEVRDIDEDKIRIVKKVIPLGHGQYDVVFQDGMEATYDSGDKFELVYGKLTV